MTTFPPKVHWGLLGSQDSPSQPHCSWHVKILHGFLLSFCTEAGHAGSSLEGSRRGAF